MDLVFAVVPALDGPEARALWRIDNVFIIAADCADEAGWRHIAKVHQAAVGEIDVMVHCPSVRGDDANRILRSNWLALQHSHRFMAKRGGGTMVIACRAPQPGVFAPALDAALAGTRLSATAAILDAMKVGLAPRCNRLVFDDDVAEGPFRASLAALVDDRSSFMTGGELLLSGSAGSDDTRLSGKTILVTGATSGIGRATAVEIGRLGGFVAVGGRKPKLADETLELVRAAGGDGMVVPLDVTDPAAWSQAVAAVMTERGALHGLVNNAGEARNKPIAALTAADFDFLTGINLMGTMLGIDACCEALAASGGGAIVNIASVAGIRAAPGGSAYGASKAAVIGLSQSYARAEGNARGVRINALQPGLIWSDSVADSLGEEGAAAFRAMIEPKTPLGRVGAPDEIGRMVAFLLSDAAAPISGQAISVSGGLEFNLP
ncbi:SDR family NAD(P)-dependent oxidoreductase [Glacieibacterium megasporae]|uniref:SDR family NAD(P)-dependent oxidoreductase n=1 Tax=Glacieibacterium megasporae TaxID=2835787 RepID=UPI001C1E76C1|nr:SDR family NAD(P)-dependent oxidoreductase [Polymorphobacter megasporae]UAJ09116.1 SDR family oxidoreductase [Polymorphobacter megasporae]